MQQLRNDWPILARGNKKMWQATWRDATVAMCFQGELDKLNPSASSTSVASADGGGSMLLCGMQRVAAARELLKYKIEEAERPHEEAVLLVLQMLDAVGK
mmetsp:Transcript_588/g.2117  ORF Transcript_588/g.2117 Transcript_588/m.2117 type:complete len:100 (+) Transcript_588:761-1060(+)